MMMRNFLGTAFRGPSDSSSLMFGAVNRANKTECLCKEGVTAMMTFRATNVYDMIKWAISV